MSPSITALFLPIGRFPSTLPSIAVPISPSDLIMCPSHLAFVFQMASNSVLSSPTLFISHSVHQADFLQSSPDPNFMAVQPLCISLLHGLWAIVEFTPYKVFGKSLLEVSAQSFCEYGLAFVECLFCYSGSDVLFTAPVACQQATKILELLYLVQLVSIYPWSPPCSFKSSSLWSSCHLFSSCTAPQLHLSSSKKDYNPVRETTSTTIHD